MTTEDPRIQDKRDEAEDRLGERFLRARLRKRAGQRSSILARSAATTSLSPTLAGT